MLGSSESSGDLPPQLHAHKLPMEDFALLLFPREEVTT